ncbi:hypothetical protein D3C75_1286220 [compost metagenome]
MPSIHWLHSGNPPESNTTTGLPSALASGTTSPAGSGQMEGTTATSERSYHW